MMAEHARNHRGVDGLAGTATNLANRPRQVRQAIDAALTELGDYVGRTESASSGTHSAVTRLWRWPAAGR